MDTPKKVYVVIETQYSTSNKIKTWERMELIGNNQAQFSSSVGKVMTLKDDGVLVENDFLREKITLHMNGASQKLGSALLVAFYRLEDANNWIKFRLSIMEE